jgi:hypothetical protein
LQDYKEAARLRDSLRSFEEEEPVLRLRRLMKKAIEEQRFEVVDSCSTSLFLPISVFTTFSCNFSKEELAVAKLDDAFALMDSFNVVPLLLIVSDGDRDLIR